MIEVKDLSFSYGRGTPEILKRIAFSAPEGTITAILGNNGVGKSTLLKCLNRILKPQRGEILLEVQMRKRSPTRSLPKGSLMFRRA